MKFPYRNEGLIFAKITLPKQLSFWLTNSPTCFKNFSVQ